MHLLVLPPFGTTKPRMVSNNHKFVRLSQNTTTVINGYWALNLLASYPLKCTSTNLNIFLKHTSTITCCQHNLFFQMRKTFFQPC